VTKYAAYLFVVGIIIAVIAILEFIFYSYPSSLIVGIIIVVFAVLAFIDGLGLFLGQPWALKLSGYSNRAWAQAPDVREYFGLPLAYPAYPPSAPSASPSSPVCPTCGQPLRYVQQYQRWYCDREQKYI
jgi:hypothetical protein